MKDVIDYLKDLHHIEIQLDEPALKQAGVESDRPVTRNLKGISLGSALRLTLGEMQLTYAVRGGVLLITSPARAGSEECLATGFYPVADLVPPKSDGSVDLRPLKDMLTHAIAPKTWSDGGGRGTLSETVVDKRLLLVIKQTEEVHDQIGSALRSLREVVRLTAEAEKNGRDAAARRDLLEQLRRPIDLCGRVDTVALGKIRNALAQPTNIEFLETPVKDVTDYLKDVHHIEIQFDEPALKQAGVEYYRPVTKNLKGVSLRSGLHSVLDEMRLTYVVRNGVLLITSPAMAESRYLETRFYVVEDLVPPQPGGSAATGGLQDLLIGTVAAKSWSRNGGAGFVGEIILGKQPILVVWQSEDVHEKVADTLETLRKVGQPKAGPLGHQDPEKPANKEEP